MSARLARFGSLVVLLAWAAPGAGALGVALHLALVHDGHHGPHGDEHERELAGLVRAATHGHHHDLGSDAEHEHYARVVGPAPAPRPAPLPAVLPATSPLAARSFGPRPLDGSRLRGPPRPLFTAHCSLLL